MAKGQGVKEVDGRAYNFSAGPAPIFPEILNSASEDVISYGNTGVSILELGHRTKTFSDLEADTSKLLSEVMEVPDGYEVLWMQGGATGMFSSVVYNFYLGPDHPICFVVSGNWSGLALREAQKLGAKCEVIMTCGMGNYPKDFTIKDSIDIVKKASYVYYCDNETVTGFEFPAAGTKGRGIEWLYEIPDSVPVICDMTSNIMSRKFDIQRYSVIFASAQKNLATSGITLVLVKREVLERYKSSNLFLRCPTILDMSIMLANRSTYNTPPVFQLGVCKIALEYFKKIGGVDYFEKKSKKLVSMVEEAIASSKGFYFCLIEKPFRSSMNIVFRICPNRDGVFSSDAENEAVSLASKSYNVIGIKGHRALGGIRISLYNAVEIEHVEKLCEFLLDFMKLKSNL